MPKSRKRANQKGAKSVPIRVKHKIGGRKSNKGVKQMSIPDLFAVLEKGRKRDYNKALRELVFGRQVIVMTLEKV